MWDRRSRRSARASRLSSCNTPSAVRCNSLSTAASALPASTATDAQSSCWLRRADRPATSRAAYHPQTQARHLQDPSQSCGNPSLLLAKDITFRHTTIRPAVPAEISPSEQYDVKACGKVRCSLVQMRGLHAMREEGDRDAARATAGPGRVPRPPLSQLAAGVLHNNVLHGVRHWRCRRECKRCGRAGTVAARPSNAL